MSKSGSFQTGDAGGSALWRSAAGVMEKTGMQIVRVASASGCHRRCAASVRWLTFSLPAAGGLGQ
jgi:hypothetical protein